MSVEFVGIELQLRGEDGVRADLQELDRLLKSLGGKKQVKLGMNELKKDIMAASRELDELIAKRDKLANAMSSGKVNNTEFWSKQYEKASQAVEKTTADLKNQKVALQEVSLATRTAGQSFMQNFKQASSALTHLGSKMQTLGNTLNKLATPFNRLMSGTVFAAGYKLLNMMTSGISGATQRSDIMSTYRPIMTALAGDVSDVTSLNKQLEDSLERLNESVLGLPTGLDEIVDMHKQLTIATGDMTKAEQLAIASNNAYLAGGADEAIVTQGKRMLQTLATTGDLTAKQWNSLRKAIPVTWNEMQKEIEGDLTELSADEFMDLLIDKGINGKTKEVVLEMLHTYNAATANIENAFRRMGQNVLATLDDILKEATGKDTIDTLIAFKDAINSLSEGVQNWMRANPEVIIGFLDAIKSVNWKGFFEGMGEGLALTVKQASALINLFGQGKGMERIGRFMSRAGLYAKVFTVFGGLLKGLSIPLAGAYAIFKHFFNEGGLFGFLGSLFGGKGAADAAGNMGMLTKASGSLVALVKNLGLVAGSVAIISGTGFVAFKAVKSMVKDMADIIAISKTIEWKDAQKVISDMIMTIGLIGGISAVIGASGIAVGLGATMFLGILGTITTLITGFAALDTWLVKKAVENFKKTTDSIIEIKNNLNEIKSISIDKGAIQTVMKDLGEVFDALRPTTTTEWGGQRNITASEAKGMSKIMGYLATAIGSLKELKDIFEEVDGFKGFSTGTVEDIKQLFSDLGDIYDEIRKNFNSTSGTDARGADQVTKIVESTKSTFDAIIGENGIAAQIEKMSKSLPNITIGQGKSPLTFARQQLDKLFDEIGNMYSEIQKKYGWMITTTSTGTINDITENVHELFNKIIGEEGLIAQVKNMFKELPAITSGGDRGTQSMVGQVGDYMTDFFNGINKLFSDEVWKKSDLQQAMNEKERYKAVIEAVGDMFGLLVGENGIIAQVTELASSMPSMVSGGYGGSASPLSLVMQSIDDLFLQISGMYEYFSGTAIAGADMGEFKTTMESLKTAIRYISDAVVMLQEMQGITLNTSESGNLAIIEQVEDLVSQLQDAFTAESIEALSLQVETFKTSLASLKEALENIGSIGGEGSEGINVDINIVPNITGDTETVEKLNTAHDNIEKARDSIKKLSQSINLSFPISVSLDGLDAAVTSIYSAASRIRTARSSLTSAQGSGSLLATGGMVYRAGGGSIPYRRRGTDTVPAMLTPGEYVHNKRAVSMFGIDFMRKVNALDMRGAMNELLARAGHMANVSRGTVINNTYNNNQSVTINNGQSAGAGFTFKSASRFAGAL